MVNRKAARVAQHAQFFGSKLEVSTSRKVEHHLRQGFIHRHKRITVTLDAAFITQGLKHCHSKGDASVLREVMDVHRQVPDALDKQADMAPAAHLSHSNDPAAPTAHVAEESAKHAGTGSVAANTTDSSREPSTTAADTGGNVR